MALQARTEFASALNQVCSERGIEPEVVLETIRQAILAAYRKDYGEPEDIEVEIDANSGEVTLLKGKKNVTLAGSYGILTGTPKDIEYIAAQLCANILNDMISKKLYPQMYTQATMQGKAISAFMVQSSIFSPTLKEMIEPYRVMWVDVG